MRTPPLLADFSHARPCKPFCENSLTLPRAGKLTLSSSEVLYYDFSGHQKHSNKCDCGRNEVVLMEYGIWTLIPVLFVIAFALKTKRTLNR